MRCVFGTGPRCARSRSKQSTEQTSFDEVSNKTLHRYKMPARCADILRVKVNVRFKKMKYLLPVLFVIFAGCSAQRSAQPSAKFNPIVTAGQMISSNNWSKSDPGSGKIINETDSHWDIAFPIPDAIQGGEKPDHRIVRVFKKTKQVKELGID